jgi:hypothetical protein
LKWFAITDEYTPECSALEVDRGVTADRVMDILTNLFLTRRVRRHNRSDNGPEFIATGIRRHGEQAGLAVGGVAVRRRLFAAVRILPIDSPGVRSPREQRRA